MNPHEDILPGRVGAQCLSPRRRLNSKHCLLRSPACFASCCERAQKSSPPFLWYPLSCSCVLNVSWQRGLVTRRLCEIWGSILGISLTSFFFFYEYALSHSQFISLAQVLLNIVLKLFFNETQTVLFALDAVMTSNTGIVSNGARITVASCRRGEIANL